MEPSQKRPFQFTIKLAVLPLAFLIVCSCGSSSKDKKDITVREKPWEKKHPMVFTLSRSLQFEYLGDDLIYYYCPLIAENTTNEDVRFKIDNSSIFIGGVYDSVLWRTSTAGYYNIIDTPRLAKIPKHGSLIIHGGFVRKSDLCSADSILISYRLGEHTYNESLAVSVNCKNAVHKKWDFADLKKRYYYLPGVYESR